MSFCFDLTKKCQQKRNFDTHATSYQNKNKMSNKNSCISSVCILCANISDNLVSIHEFQVEDNDGAPLHPLDRILEYVDGDLTKIPKNAQCCELCCSKLKRFAILEKSFLLLKNDLLESLKKQRIFKRKRTKGSTQFNDFEFVGIDENTRFENYELTEPEFQNATQNFEAKLALFNDYLTKNVNFKTSKCVMARIVENRTWCLSKHCQFEVKFDLSTNTQDKSLKIWTTGGKSPHIWDDYNRIKFELTKNEFTEESICEFCCSKFNSDDELSSHQKSCPGSISNENCYKCPECGLETKSFNARNSHFLLQHSVHSPYECTACKKTFKTKYKKTQHERICLTNLRFPCTKCEKTFSARKNLREHNRFQHERHKYQPAFKCEFCGKTFFRKCNYDNHIVKHDDSRPYPCTHPGCGLAFKRPKTLKSHVDLKHNLAKTKKYLCSTCGQEFESFTGYKQHCAKHSGVPYIKRNYACKHCGKTFRYY